MEPSVGSIRRLIIRNVVVLPHPDGPTKATISDSGTPKVRSVTAAGPVSENRLVTLYRAIAAASRSTDKPYTVSQYHEVMVSKASKPPVRSESTTPVVGDRAPAFSLVDQRGDTVRLSSFKGRRVLMYFYPRADTPGCTTQACGLRDIAGDVGDTVIIGISTDPVAKLARFDDKYSLGFTLLSDPDHVVAEKYGVWVEKKLYGKVSMGVARSAFLISPTGRIERAWPKISPADTPTALLTALDEVS